jgi:hypothetical protein
MLENTICIKPHKEIKDFQYHRYTYDKTNNVVFHSNPEKIIKSSFRFSDKIDVLLNADKEIDLARMLINLVEIFKGYKKDVDNIFSNYLSYYEIDIKKIKEKKDIVKLGIIMEFYLKDNHNILQYGIFNKT